MIDVKQRAQSHDLSKPLDRSFLASLELEEIKTLKKVLIERAVKVIGEIKSLEAFDEFEKNQFARGMFRCEFRTDDTGELILNYSPEPRFAEDNLFVPGAWFAEHLEKLDALRAKKQENAETFEDRNKEKLINELLGGRNAGKAAAV